MKGIISKQFFGLLFAASLMGACGSTALVSTPIENVDTIPLKISALGEEEKKVWGHGDLFRDTVPGMSIDRAYEEIITDKKGETIIVAVLDSGIDLTHEDLDGVLWTNEDEIAGNGKDDDNNGFIDDIHGYNFLGSSYDEQLEYARILRLKLGDAALQARAKAELDKERNESLQNKQQYEQILEAVKAADAAVREELGKNEYTKEEVVAIETEDPEMQQHVGVITQMFNFKPSIAEVMEQLNEGITYFSDRLDHHLNVEFNGRTPVGDDPYKLDDLGYGNGNPMRIAEDEEHGTHVAGIIAAERDNGKGVKGVANNVRLMSLRAVPNGDEYDKDIALGIRYAVDNGARIINASFGKSYSPKAEWVYEAIKYAASKDVLIVHAAGNDGADLDDPANSNFPNDQVNTGPEIADNVLTVGALDPVYGSEMISAFSNYGKSNIDIFAPGGEIYSTMPGNRYDYSGGTSMAAPAVSGIAALLFSRYPKLTAAEVKKIIMESGLSTKSAVILGGDAEKASPFETISKSGKMANAYNALILGDQVSRGKIKL